MTEYERTNQFMDSLSEDLQRDTDSQLSDLYEALYVVAYVIECLRLEPTINQYRSIFTGSGAYDLAFSMLHKYADQYDAIRKGEG